MSGPNGEGPLPSRAEVVNVRLSADELAEIDRWADEEHRKRSQMIRVLIFEALAARQRSDKDVS